MPQQPHLRFETAHRSQGGPAPRLHPVTAAVAAALIAGYGVRIAEAGPTGEVLVGGHATVQRPNARTTIVSQTTPRAAIDWNGFSISANEAVHFQQPSASSIALNRVVLANPSVIAGSLQATGQVFLVNPSGILFASGASVNVAGLVASTLNIAPNDFMNGRYAFSGGTKELVVQKDVTIKAGERGYVALLANRVSNAGEITASQGTVALGAGRDMVLDFHGDGLLSLKVNGAAAGAKIDHAKGGVIVAEGGRVIMTAAARNALLDTVLNVDGIVQARGATMRNGAIYLDGGDSGVTRVAGTLDVSNAQGRGGEVRVLGEYVGLFERAKIDASGASGGGTVLVGGDYRGRNPDVKNAFRTVIAPAAMIAADATVDGDGGKVIVWADNYTRFAGSISARGGPRGGDGGLVETSGKDLLIASGKVDARAPAGRAGTWLLDPRDITIVNSTPGPDNDNSVNADFSGGNPNTFTPSTDDSRADAQNIIDSLNAGGSVIITTGSTGLQAGNITVAGTGDIGGPVDINKTLGTAATLTLEAAGNIVMNPGSKIRSSSNALSVVLNADRDANGVGSITLNGATITSNGGAIHLFGGGTPGASTTPVSITGGSALSSDAGEISIIGKDAPSAGFARGVSITSSTIATSSGGIKILGTGGSTASGNAGVLISDSSTEISTSGTGKIEITGTGGAGDAGALQGQNAGIVVQSRAKIRSTSTAADAGSITLTGGGGSGGIDPRNYGVWLLSLANEISAEKGSIAITGTGTDSFGVRIEGRSVVGKATMAGDILLHSLGGTGMSIELNSPSPFVAAEPTIRTNGNVTLNASGGGAVSVPGIIVSNGLRLLADAPAATFTVDNAANNAATLAVDANGASVSYRDIDSLDIGSVTSARQAGQIPTETAGVIAAGTLTVTTAGAITQSRPAVVSGTSSFAGGANAIALSNSGNDFGGPVTLSNSGASNDISIVDMNSLTLNGASFGRSLTATASGGDITLASGQAFSKVSPGAGSTLRLNASGDINVNSGVTIQPGGGVTGGLSIVLNANSDGVGTGRIDFKGAAGAGNRVTLTTDGGNIRLGGGDATLASSTFTSMAAGDAANGEGVRLSFATLSAGAGSVAIFGKGGSMPTGGNDGVLLTDATLTANGGVTIAGTGGGAGGGSNNVGVHAIGTSNSIATVSGDIVITGEGAGATSQNHGVAFGKTAVSTSGTGNIAIAGAASAGGIDNLGIFLSDSTVSSTSNAAGAGSITLTGSTADGTGNRGVSMQSGAAISATAAAVTLNATDIDITTGTAITAAGRTVTLRPTAAGRAISIGSDASNSLGVTNDELNRITADTIVVGRNDSGNAAGPITVTSAVQPLNASTLSLITGDTIANAAGGSPMITVDSLALRAANGIGSSATPLRTQVDNVAFVNTGAGGVTLENTGALALANVNGIAASSSGSAALKIVARSPFTFGVNFSQDADIDVTAGESGLADDVTVATGVTVQSNLGNVTLRSGDHVKLESGSVVRAAAAGKTVTLVAGFADTDSSGAISGAGRATASSVVLDALSGVGTSAARFATTAATLAARTSATGGVFVDATPLTSTVAIASPGAGFTNGTAGGAFSVASTGGLSVTDTVVTLGGAVTLSAAGALTVANLIDTTPSAANTSGGSVILEAGGELTLDVVPGTGAITTTGTGSGAGGEVFIHHRANIGPADILLQGPIVATGGATGPGGVVSVLNSAGNIFAEGKVDVSRGVSALSATKDGTIQLQAAGFIDGSGALTGGDSGVFIGSANGALLARTTNTTGVGYIDLPGGCGCPGPNAIASVAFETRTANDFGYVSYTSGISVTVGTAGGAGTLTAPSGASAGAAAIPAFSGVKTVVGEDFGTVSVRAFDATGFGMTLPAITVAAPIVTTPASGTGLAGSSVDIQADGNITSTSAGTIDTRGASSTAAGIPGGDGGEVFLYSAGSFATPTVTAIELRASIDASGGAGGAGADGGFGGVVTLQNDSGSIVAHDVITIGGTGGGSPGLRGPGGQIQLATENATAGGTIGQQFGTRLEGASLLVLSTDAVSLTNAGNTVDTLAALIQPRGDFSYNNAGALTIGSLPVVGSTFLFATDAAGITTGGGNVRVGASGALTVDEKIDTQPAFTLLPAPGGSVLLESGGPLTITSGGSIITTGDLGGGAGEVFLRAGQGNVTLGGPIDAYGSDGPFAGDNGGPGGVVTIVAADGGIAINDVIDVSGGFGAGAGNDGVGGTIQLSTGSSGGAAKITQTAALFAVGSVRGSLAIVSAADDVTLTGAFSFGGDDNDIGTIAANIVAPGKSFSFIGLDGVSIGTVARAGSLVAPSGAAAQPAADTLGIRTRGGAVSVANIDTFGTGAPLVVNQPIVTTPNAGSNAPGGPVVLEADGPLTIATTAPIGIDTTGAANPAGAGGEGGEVFLFALEDIAIGSSVVARGGAGTTGGNGGVFTVVNGGDLLIDAAIDASGGAGSATRGNGGTIQLGGLFPIGGEIMQSGATAATALLAGGATPGSLSVFGLTNVSLENPANDVGTVAASIFFDGPFFRYANAGPLTIGSVSAAGSALLSIVLPGFPANPGAPRTGITTGGDVRVQSLGALTVDQPIVTAPCDCVGDPGGSVVLKSGGPLTIANTFADMIVTTGGVGEDAVFGSPPGAGGKGGDVLLYSTGGPIILAAGIRADGGVGGAGAAGTESEPGGQGGAGGAGGVVTLRADSGAIVLHTINTAGGAGGPGGPGGTLRGSTGVVGARGDVQLHALGGTITQALGTALSGVNRLKVIGDSDVTLNQGSDALVIAARIDGADKSFTYAPVGPIAVGNVPAGLSMLDGGSADLPAVNGISTSGHLTLTANGAITQTAPIAADDATLSAGANAIALDNALNDFRGRVSASNSGANDILLRDANALELGTVTAGQDLFITASGGITQGGALSVARNSIFDAGAGAIALDRADNHFSGTVRLVNTGANDAFVRDDDALAISADVGRNLSVTAGGAVSQSGALVVSGASSFTAAGPIALGNAGNDFGGAVSLSTSAGDISVTDANALTIGSVNAGGGDIAFTAGTALTLPSIATAGSQTYIALNTILEGNLVAGSGGILIDGSTSLTGDRAVSSSGAIFFDGSIGGSGRALTIDAGTTLRVTGLTNIGSLNATAPASMALAALTASAGATLTSDRMALATISAPGATVTLRNSTSGRPIVLGGESADSLSLGDAELAGINARRLIVGRDNSGGITVAGDVGLPVGTLHLVSGAAITATSGGIVLPGGDLAIEARGPVAFTDADNDVRALAAALTTPAGAPPSSLSFSDATALVVGTVDGISGITAPAGAAVTLNSASDLTLSHAIVAGRGGSSVSITSGGLIAGNGSISADSVVLDGAGGIGAGSGARVNTNADRLTATSGGGIFIASPVRFTAGALTATGSGAAIDLVTSGDEPITLAGDITTNNGAISIGARALLGADVAMAANGGDITFAATLESPATPRALTITSGNVLRFMGAVGGNGNPLSSLATTVTSAAIDGGVVTTTGSQTYNNPVVIGANTSLTSSGGDIAFGGALDADSFAAARTLLVDAPAGTVTFSGSVGGNAAFADLDVISGPNTTVFNGSSPQVVNVNAGSGGNTVSFTGNVLLGQNVAIDTGGGANNDVVFANGIETGGSTSRTLAIDAGSGDVSLQGVGNATPLAMLTANGGRVSFNRNAVAQQIFIGADQILTNGTATLVSPLAFAGYDGPAALTLTGPATGGGGAYGGEANMLRVDVPGLLVVTPNASRVLFSTVWLQGDPLKKPFYQWYSDPSRREVVYNGRPIADPQQTREILEHLDSPRNAASLAAADAAAAARAPELCTAAEAKGEAVLACAQAER